MSLAWAEKLNGMPETLAAIIATVAGKPANSAWMWSIPCARHQCPSATALGSTAKLRRPRRGSARWARAICAHSRACAPGRRRGSAASAPRLRGAAKPKVKALRAVSRAKSWTSSPAKNALA